MTLRATTRRFAARLRGIALVLIACNAAARAASTEDSPPPSGGRVRRRANRRRELNNDHFNMRIFWKKGYRWQESSSERKWCMQCKTNRCLKGSGIKIEKCNRDDWRQHFYFDDGRIRSRRNKSVCLEREGRSIALENCDGSINQVWNTLKKNEPFQLRIPGKTQKCASQHHHPRQGEKVYMTSCKKSVESQTDKWVVY